MRYVCLWYLTSRDRMKYLLSLFLFELYILSICAVLLRFSLSWITLIFVELQGFVGSGGLLVLMKISGGT